MRDRAAALGLTAQSLAGFCFALASVGFFCLMIFDFGFRKNEIDADVINFTYLILLLILFCGEILIELFSFSAGKRFALLFKLFILSVVSLALLIHFELINIPLFWLDTALHGKQALIICSLVLMISEIHHVSKYLSLINMSA